MLIEKHCLKGSLQPIVIDPFDMKAELGRFLELAFCNDTGTEVRGCPGEKAKMRSCPIPIGPSLPLGS
jgi:hypothetical protein